MTTILTARSGQEIELSFHPPSRFVAENLPAILPDWNAAEVWVVLMLQQSRFPLDSNSNLIEAEKDLLRERFLKFALEAISLFQNLGFCSDFIDPRTGYPGLSSKGTIPHDDTAAFAALRGFKRTQNQCFTLHHPRWGTNSYPSVFMTAAPAAIAQPILLELALQQGWILNT
jgi:hypothetical protein